MSAAMVCAMMVGFSDGADISSSGIGQARIELPPNSEWETVWARKGDHEWISATAKGRRDGTVEIWVWLTIEREDDEKRERLIWIDKSNIPVEAIQMRLFGHQLQMDFQGDELLKAFGSDIPSGRFCLRFKRVK